MTRTGLRIMIVSPALPSTSWGFGTRVFHLARHLSERHAVTLLGYGSASHRAYAESLRDTGFDVRLVERELPGRMAKRTAQVASVRSSLPFGCQEVHSEAMQHAIDVLSAAERFDIVQVESSQMCTFRFPDGAAVILDEHNVEYELLRRMGDGERTRARRLYNRFEHTKLRRFEQRAWRRVDACAVTSEREVAIVGRHAPATPTTAVPNAVDHVFFAPSALPVEPDTVVFTGLLSYRPNLDAARFLVDEIMPAIRRSRPRATLTIIGHGPPGDLDSLRGPGVTVAGWVGDIRPHVARAAVAAVPVRIGGGTRLKVVEALAMAKAVVSTTVGCEGLRVRDMQHLSIGDGAEGFAARTVELLTRPELASGLGRAGRSLVIDEYSWGRSVASLEELYGRVVGRRRRPSETAGAAEAARHGG